uniref:Uncharacterized protein n=1 Tax=Octopus bimaculoides TaxID=37653 RepID=A0A0L8FJR8_OCTBM
MCSCVFRSCRAHGRRRHFSMPSESRGNVIMVRFESHSPINLKDAPKTTEWHLTALTQLYLSQGKEQWLMAE